MRRSVLVGLTMLPALAQAAPKWVDKPAWPAKPTAIELTWLVYPVPPDATTIETTKAPLTLEVTIGSVTRTIKLDAQLGQLKPEFQAACKTSAFPLAKGEVAKIAFEEGGFGGYFVRRAGDVLSIVDWSMTDGACPDKRGNPGPCPRHEQVKVQLHAPNVPVHEHIVQVDDTGARHAFACS